MKELTYPWNNLNVEVAVKLYEALHGEGDETSVIYEFIPEAARILDQYVSDVNMSRDQLGDLIASVINDSLNHYYPSDAFLAIADFVISRAGHFRSTAQI